MRSSLSAFLFASISAAALFAQPGLPTGFVHEVIVDQDLTKPCGLAFLPDGRLLVVEEDTGKIKIIAGQNLEEIGEVEGLSTDSDRSLNGIAVDPKWPTWPYVYVQFTHDDSASVRILRFTAAGELTNSGSCDIHLDDPYFVLIDPPDEHPHHNGGTLRFGADGMLYSSLGDDRLNSCDAQDNSVLAGVILRLDISGIRGLTGSGPPSHAQIAAAGNPHAGPNAQLIWASGLRNPFRFHIDPVTQNLYAADVGAITVEEINEITGPGENFGWPHFEGAFQSSLVCMGIPPVLKAPIHSYLHTTLPVGGGCVISLGGRYRNRPGAPFNFGVAYEGSLFYSDFVVGFLRRLEWDGVTWAPAAPVAGQPNPTDWGTGFAGAVDALVGQDGALYYTNRSQGLVARIRPDVSTATLSIVSGNNQSGNAGRRLAQPLVVKLTDLQGAPLGGQVVTFSVSPAGTVSPEFAFTQADGTAFTLLTLAESPPANPVVVAQSSGASAVALNATWRGLHVTYVPPPLNFSTIGLFHSQTSSPFTLVIDVPPPSPYVQVEFGALWTSLLAPNPGLLAFDGLGLFGPPDPVFKTAAGSPTWSIGIVGFPPLGGLSVIMQAYAIDTSLLPDTSAFVITNPEIVVFD